ncbi:MAG: L-threonylcarbamoyladenylate synthase, partial [Leptospiraceae bacterium]|nr:L-threonylcarbamoyladenylate synthase [Leptospiraceae bacterium]
MMELTEDIEKAAHYIKNGKLVLFPTETVYGLGASSWNFEACEKIYKVKGRPKDNPFIIHVGRIEDIFELGEVHPKYEELIYKFSPGPISFILRKRKKNLFSTGLPTIGIRVPSLPKTIEFLKLAGPVSAPSANLSGKPSITKVEYLLETFQNSVDLLLLGEEPEIGIESTVIDLSHENPILLRPGKISSNEIKNFLPNLKIISKAEEKPVSPGLKYRHYSP